MRLSKTYENLSREARGISMCLIPEGDEARSDAYAHAAELAKDFERKLMAKVRVLEASENLSALDRKALAEIQKALSE